MKAIALALTILMSLPTAHADTCGPFKAVLQRELVQALVFHTNVHDFLKVAGQAQKSAIAEDLYKGGITFGQVQGVSGP